MIRLTGFDIKFEVALVLKDLRQIVASIVLRIIATFGN